MFQFFIMYCAFAMDRETIIPKNDIGLHVTAKGVMSASSVALKKQTELMHNMCRKKKRRKADDEVVQMLKGDDISQDQSINHGSFLQNLNLSETEQSIYQLGFKRKRDVFGTQETEGEDVQMLDADDLCASLENDTVLFKQVGIRCSQEIFNCAGSTFAHVIQDCPTGDRLEAINQIFKDLDADQTVLLIKAISAISRDKKDIDGWQQHLSFFTSKLEKDDLLFLLKKANYLDIPALQEKCSDLLVQNASYNFSEIVKLPYELAEPILMSRFDCFDRLLLKRGGLVKFQISVSESMSIKAIDELNKLYIVQDGGRFFFYDVENGIYKEILIPCDYTDSVYFEAKKCSLMADGLIIKLSNRILKYNFCTDECKELFVLHDDEQFYSEMLFNQTKTGFLVRTSVNKIYVLDLQRKRYHQIVKMEDDEYIISYAFNEVGDHAVVLTNLRLINYDIEKCKPVIMTGIHMRESPQIVIFDSLQKHLFLHSRNHMYACNIKTGKCEQIFNTKLGQLIRYVSYQGQKNKLFIETDRSVYMYDEQDGSSTELFYKNRSERMGERCATLNKEGRRLLIQTNRRALLFDLFDDVSLIGSINLDLMRSVICCLNSSGDKVLIKARNKLFLYTVESQECQKKMQVGLYETLNAMFNQNGDQILISTDNCVFVYDIDAERLIPFFEKKLDEVLQEVYFSKDGSMIVVKTDKRLLLYNSYSGECKGVFAFGLEEFWNDVQLHDSGKSVLIKTNERLLNWTLSDIPLLQQLNAEQCDFITKASHAWQCNKPHLVRSEEVPMYHSLPDVFKQVHLFI
ncbi:MAG: WD40 repeat domain-containing protein [Candidatus Dependentiae bacterium]